MVGGVGCHTFTFAAPSLPGGLRSAARLFVVGGSGGAVRGGNKDGGGGVYWMIGEMLIWLTWCC